MTGYLEQTRSQREDLKRCQADPFSNVRHIICRYDRADIMYFNDTGDAVNPDEYDPEVGTSLPRLKTADSATDVAGIAHEKFVRWFDDEIAGPHDKYLDIGRDIWNARRKQRLDNK